MEKTTNYGLNQWQTTDRILMSDFNADNQKLDAALAGLSSKMTWETVRDIVTEEDASQIDLDISDVNLRDYVSLILRIDQNTKSAAFYVRAGKIGDNTSYSKGQVAGETSETTNLAHLSAAYPQVALLLTGGPGNHYLQALSLNGFDLMMGSCSLKCAQVTKLTLWTQGAVPAGLHIKLIGVKAE